MVPSAARLRSIRIRRFALAFFWAAWAPLGYAGVAAAAPPAAQAPQPTSAPSVTSAAAPSAAPSIAPALVEIGIGDTSGHTITFTGLNAPKPLKTGLSDLDYIGALKPHDGSMPYFLFAADPCSDCSAERALYLVRPAATGKPQLTQFVYPGRILDPRTHAVVLQSRAFYGRCLAPKRGDSGDDVYVVFQRERVDSHHGRRHRLLDSVYVADASSDFLRDRLVERRQPSLRRTLTYVRTRKCHEIDGRNRFLELHPRGLDWQNIQKDDAPGDMDDDSGPDNGAGDPASD